MYKKGGFMRVISDSCINCGSCSAVCPVQCIFPGDTQYHITETCIDCGSCQEVCPVGAISILEH